MDQLPDFKPTLLAGLTWSQARGQLEFVDCALRRPDWCGPVVILANGDLLLDSDGDVLPFDFAPDDRDADDWMMVERCDDDGNPVPLSFRQQPGER